MLLPAREKVEWKGLLSLSPPLPSTPYQPVAPMRTMDF